MNNPIDVIKKVTNTILFNPERFGDLREGLHELHDVYAAASGIAAKNITDNDMWLPSGNAVSPIKAAHCLLEIQRTAVFIRGVYKALLRLQSDFPDTRLNILYAGCGPYATLVTLLTCMFAPHEIGFYLLDVNPVSVEAVKRMYRNLKLDDYVEAYIIADATTYVLPANITIHMVISETMLNALRKEPQVDIMLNLIPQLPSQSFFIPHNITVSAQLLNMRQEAKHYVEPYNEPVRMNLGTVYAIGRNACKQHVKTTIQIHQPDTNGYNSLNLLTQITTFEDEQLNIYDSSLNMPLLIGDVNGYEGRNIAFTYVRGEKPRFCV